MTNPNDALDDLIAKHTQAQSGNAGADIIAPVEKPNVPPMPSELILPHPISSAESQIQSHVNEYEPNMALAGDAAALDLVSGISADAQPVETPNESPKSDDVDYGDNDLAEEIAMEERIEKQQKAEAAKELAAARAEEAKTTAPPQPYDPITQSEDVNFQADKIGIVTTMVNKVVAKYHLVEGCIPETPDINRGIFGRRAVMGNLIEEYENNGGAITAEFENIILTNWVMPDGSTADVWVKTPHEAKGEPTNNQSNNVPVVDPDAVPQLTINIPEGSDVTVNVDSEVVRSMSESKKIDVIVRRVSEEELKSINIIENTQQDGIIQIYDTDINQSPVTLPASSYRTVLRPINWFDFIRLVAPTSQNRVDDELKKWSVIYKHIKNPSIGEFKDFDHFLKATKYQDRELLMWAILVATADEEESLSLKCQNPKCGQAINLKYRPRTIIHLDPDHIPDNYDAVHNAAHGQEAIDIYNKSSNVKRRYKLPNTGIIVEIGEPSAHEFITSKLRLMEELYRRYVPNGDMSQMNPEDPAMAEFDYLSANALYITAMVIRKDDKEYRFTHWEDIEKIITESLDADDSGILLKIISKSRANISPVSFYLEDVVCPRCGRVEKRIPINDIGNTLLFRVSRRLDNTEINLIEMQ